MTRKHLSLICFSALLLDPVVAKSQTPVEIPVTHDLPRGSGVNKDRYSQQKSLAVDNRFLALLEGGRGLPLVCSPQRQSLELPPDGSDSPLPPAVEAALDTMKSRIADLETELAKI
jgi:hypothetical protein